MHWSNNFLILLVAVTTVAALVRLAARELARVKLAERAELRQKLGLRGPDEAE